MLCRSNAGRSKASASKCCCAPAKNAQHAALRVQLPFFQWQARRLIYFDLQFLAWLTFTYAMYGVKTTKLLCGQAAKESEYGVTCGEVRADAPEYCNWAWQVACCSVTSSWRGWPSAVPVAAWLRSGVLMVAKVSSCGLGSLLSLVMKSCTCPHWRMWVASW